ncbi:MAG: hypothetical protein WA824_06905 [Candidatus Sulfotelmatobacter sp.]
MKLSRLTGALLAYLALGVLAVTTLSDQRVRAVTLLILGLFAFKTWVRRKDVLHPDGEGELEPAADEVRPTVDGELEMRVAAK